MPGRTVDGVGLAWAGYAADDPGRRMGGDADPPQVARSTLPAGVPAGIENTSLCPGVIACPWWAVV